MRLDDDKLEALRRWGQELRQAESEEYAAAGRAILMLLDEIGRLQIELRYARLDPGGEDAVPPDGDGEDAEDEVLSSALHERMRWIEALRRQR